MLQRANSENIQKWIDGMNQFNATPEFGTTRILFTKPELANRAYVKEEMRKLGLTVREDDIGNIFATLPGSDPALAPVWTGSHIDTVPNAGKFDGMAGVVSGMEAVRLIRESGAPHPRDIVVVAYTSEEPTRYGLSCLGSRALSGDLTLEDTRALKDQGGRTLYDKLQELGYSREGFARIRRKKGDVFAAVELHIEQNSRLEKAGIPIGIVKKICAPSNYIVEVHGKQGHAGGMDMTDRRDAYAAACEMALALEKLARECPSEYNTATVGCVRLVPNAVNVIPGKCVFTVDIRDCNMKTKQALIEEMKSQFLKIGRKRGVELTIQEDNNDIPLSCNEDMIRLLEKMCEKQELEYMELISGPYHDSLFVGRFAPTAMLFVPSKNGISHNPEEWTDYEQIARGTDVLANTLLELAQKIEPLEEMKE